jgi:response regulator RpfG family c-di-GMP phosphodiesterase
MKKACALQIALVVIFDRRSAVNDKVLFVDDDENLLEIYARAVPNRIPVTTAVSGEIALQIAVTEGPFAVVVSDMQMPGMDGIQLLERLKRVSSDTIRVMLTGISEQAVAIQAVNEGEIFRFLSKPPKRQLLVDTLEAAIRQHHLIRAEQELLEDTLKGSVEALAHVLSLSNPRMFGRTMRIKDLMRACAREMAIEDRWELETSAMLSYLGCITLPDDLVAKVLDNRKLSEQESATYARYPAASAELIGKIPRMETIANIVRYQLKGFDGSGYPLDGMSGETIPLGARILRVLHDFSRAESSEQSADKALSQLVKNAQCYDSDVIKALSDVLQLQGNSDVKPPQEIHISKLQTDMIIAQDIHLKTGVVLLCAGQKVSKTVLDRLTNFATSGAVEPNFLVQLPTYTN